MEAVSPFLTAKQVAERLGVSARLVYKLAASGKLVGYRIGTALRFTESQLQEYLQSSMTKAPQPRSTR